MSVHYLSAESDRLVRRLSEQEGISMSAVIDAALKDYRPPGSEVKRTIQALVSVDWSQMPVELREAMKRQAADWLKRHGIEGDVIAHG